MSTIEPSVLIRSTGILAPTISTFSLSLLDAVFSLDSEVQLGREAQMSDKNGGWTKITGMFVSHEKHWFC